MFLSAPPPPLPHLFVVFVCIHFGPTFMQIVHYSRRVWVCGPAAVFNMDGTKAEDLVNVLLIPQQHILNHLFHQPRDSKAFEMFYASSRFGFEFNLELSLDALKAFLMVMFPSPYL